MEGSFLEIHKEALVIFFVDMQADYLKETLSNVDLGKDSVIELLLLMAARFCTAVI